MEWSFWCRGPSLLSWKPRNVEIWLPFYLSSFGQAWVLLRRSLLLSKGGGFGQELSETDAAQVWAGLDVQVYVTNLYEHIWKRASFIYFSSFICIGGCWHCPFGQINFFTNYHFQDQNMSFPYMCCYYSITPANGSISMHVLLHKRVSRFFYRVFHLLPSLLGHTYVNMSRMGCSVGKTSLLLRNQHL